MNLLHFSVHGEEEETECMPLTEPSSRSQVTDVTLSNNNAQDPPVESVSDPSMTLENTFLQDIFDMGKQANGHHFF